VSQYVRPGNGTTVTVNDVISITTPQGTTGFGTTTGGGGGGNIENTDFLPEGTVNKYFTTARVSYEHTQGSSSSTWTINHNLGFKPNVTVVDSAGNIVEGEISYTNSNSLTVSFSTGFSGKAYIS
jgi:hypothetical protein